ncbi:MAG: hypothetical protein GQ574_10795 [Crocinitomix sp.]|nr:hypothetical protein [Crocinitomix sp.]
MISTLARFLFALLIFISWNSSAQDTEILWSRVDSVTNGCVVIDFKQDTVGNIFVFGKFSGEFRMKLKTGEEKILATDHALGSAYFIQKLDAKGNLLWAHQLITEQRLLGGLIQPNENGGVILCSSEKGTLGENDYFIQTFAADGKSINRKKIIENQAEYYDCKVNDFLIDGLGNVHLVGDFKGATLFTGHNDTIRKSGSQDAFYLRINVNFEYLGLNLYEGDGDQSINEVALINKNEIFIGGEFEPQMSALEQEYMEYGSSKKELIIAKYNDAGEQLLWSSFPARYAIFLDGFEVNSKQELIAVIGMRGIIELDSSVTSKSTENWPQYGQYVAFFNSDLHLERSKLVASEKYIKTEKLMLDQKDQLYIFGQLPINVDFDSGNSIRLIDPNVYPDNRRGLGVQKRDEDGNFLSLHYLPTIRGGAKYNVAPNGNLILSSNFVHASPRGQPNYGLITSEYSNYFAEPDSIVIRACENYFWDKTQKTYTESGVYTADENSKFQLNLTLEDLDLTITADEKEIITHAKDATFRWLDVGHNYRPLKYETDSVLSFRESGTYCVEVSSIYCDLVDTSEAVSVKMIGIHKTDLERYFTDDSKTIFNKIEREHIQLDPDEVKMIPFRDGPLYGFVKKGKMDKWLVKPRFEQVFAIYKEGAIVMDTAKAYYKGMVYPLNNYGLVNPKGKYLIPPYYRNLFNENGVYHGIRRVYRDTSRHLPDDYSDYYGHFYFDKKGKLLFEVGVHDFESFGNEDYAWFRFGRKYQIYNREGELVKEFDLDEYRLFIGIADNKLLFTDEETGLTAYHINGEFAFNLPKKGAGKVYQFSDNNFGVMGRDGDYYFCDSLGESKRYGINSGSIGMIQSYESFFKTKEFIVADYETDLFGLVDREGETRIDFKYAYIGSDVNGYRYCLDTNRRGAFVAANGDVIEELVGDEWYATSSFSRDRFILVQSYGFHDGLAIGSGRYPLPDSMLNRRYPSYSDAEKVVYRKYSLEHFYYYDTTGTVILALPDSVDLVGNFSDGLAPILTKDKLLGFIDKKGNLVIQPKYELAVAGVYPFPYIIVPYFDKGFAYIKSFKGYIDSEGNEYFSGERMQDRYNFSH